MPGAQVRHGTDDLPGSRRPGKGGGFLPARKNQGGAMISPSPPFTATAPLSPSWRASSMVKHNYLGLIILALGTVAAGFGWGMNIWGGWSESSYTRMQKSGSTWPVLRILKIEPNAKNCIRFLKAASAFGLFIVVPFVLFNIVYYINTK